MRLIRRHLQARRRGDAGFSLAEVLVTMVVMGILSAAVSALFITSVKATRATQVHNDQANTGRIAMEVMTRALRTAVWPASLASCASSCGETTAFIQANSSLVAFYADLDNTDNTVGPSQVTFGVDASGNLVETLQPADPNSASVGYTWTPCTLGAAGCSKKQHVIATDVVTTGAPIFTYYAYGSTTPLSGSISNAELANIDAVDLVLSVHNPNHSTVAATTFVGRVALSNVDIAIQASASPSA